MNVSITSFVSDGLGHSSHLVDLGDGTVLVVDPARMPTAQRDHAPGAGLRIAYVADTHTHADYVSGSPDLAAEGAEFLAPAAADLQHPHRPLADGDLVEVGNFTLEVMATPGHTPDHLCYLLSDESGPQVLFSGDSLMVGTVGRTDLLGDDQRVALAHDMYRSLRGRILTLPDGLEVYPTHGPGSFCATAGGQDRTTTIGAERASNPLLSMGEAEFVDELVGGLGTFPSYFRQLPAANRAGMAVHESVPALETLQVDDVAAALVEGAVVVDARPISRFAEAHIDSSVSIELRPVFASWLGWLVDLEHPVVFILDDDQDESDLVRQALTIGLDSILGRLRGGVEAWRDSGRAVSSIPLVDAAGIAAQVIDIRQDAKWRAGHLPGPCGLGRSDRRVARGGTMTAS